MRVRLIVTCLISGDFCPSSRFLSHGSWSAFKHDRGGWDDAGFQDRFHSFFIKCAIFRRIFNRFWQRFALNRCRLFHIEVQIDIEFLDELLSFLLIVYKDDNSFIILLLSIGRCIWNLRYPLLFCIVDVERSDTSFDAIVFWECPMLLLCRLGKLLRLVQRQLLKLKRWWWQVSWKPLFFLIIV